MAERNGRPGRRSFLKRVGAATGTGSLAVILGPAILGRSAQAAIYDSDSGANADQMGCAGPRGQVYDQDSGPVADMPGGADPDYYRRRREALTDADSGENADPVGHGCRGRRVRRTGVTDADTGAEADPAYHGRGTVEE